MLSLAMAGVLTFFASLTRYEGWVLLVAASAVVIVRSLFDRRHPKEVEANSLVFVAIGAYGIVLWILYNWIIFHNPIFFLNSSFSAQSQQKALSHVGMLGTEGHLYQSALTYGWTVVDVLGPVVAGGAAVAIGLALIGGVARGRTLAVMMLLAAPVAFNVVSLWLGQSTVRVPQVSPGGMFNDRYGIMALPLAAVSLGVVAARWRSLVPYVGAVAVLGVMMMSMGTPLTIQDGRVGASSAISEHPDTTASYLHRNYRGGEILADDSRASPFMFESGLDLKQFVTIGFEPWYKEAVRAPASNVTWVLAVDGDAISSDMAAYPDRFESFRLVSTSGPIRLYEGGFGEDRAPIQRSLSLARENSLRDKSR